jgi:hypothetical protein
VFHDSFPKVELIWSASLVMYFSNETIHQLWVVQCAKTREKMVASVKDKDVRLIPYLAHTIDVQLSISISYCQNCATF